MSRTRVYPVTCSVIECNRKSKARSLCLMHYKRLKNNGNPLVTKIMRHGLSGTLEHGSWSAMKRRCYSPNNIGYKNYGGRGITVCDRWLGKEGLVNFVEDMGKRPSPEHSIERIDNNGNYEPSNCRWATRQEQVKNQRKRTIFPDRNKLGRFTA